ncbi:MAG: GGDEF domain-containing protein [Candidatus Abyssobacteria bacterium SURF_5]|uniref:diguanylate cyclase n=1 Tax=Abyssobacteria bacterium (strain SURF_5) TaxID=2093360 RepID=A0A3A4NKM1_ABYX5|nr:MAG: GGDEF domain-containing protein [Candidatus Abyssubacteria bacterium SURF_5]
MGERRTLIEIVKPAQPPGERRPSLIVLVGRDFGRQYFLTRNEAVIGRDDDCAIQLSDARISRRHSKIVGDPGRTAAPYFRLMDLGSTNGTFLNDRKIKEAVLTDGDRIRVGSTILKYAIRDLVEIEYEEKIFRMATTDALTRLYSREYFLQQYTELFHRSERYQRPFSMMLVDIDDFKKVNDSFGHPEGDRVLEGIARAILDVVRREDLVARYGGEEFAILLPETGPLGARNPAERLRRKIEGLRFCAGEKEYSVTVSIGIAGYPEHALSMEKVLSCADSALYEAKRTGKNAVYIFSPPQEASPSR